MALPSSFTKHVLELFDDPTLAEKYRKEVYAALSERVIALKNLRKKLTASGIPETEETHTDRQIKLYTETPGLLVTFMGDEEEIEATKESGRNPRQLDIEEEIARSREAPGMTDLMISPEAIDRALATDEEANDAIDRENERVHQEWSESMRTEGEEPVAPLTKLADTGA